MTPPDPALVNAIQRELGRFGPGECTSLWVATLVASWVGPLEAVIDDVLRDSETSPLAALLRNAPGSSYAKLELSLAALPWRKGDR